jgi:3-oxoacyl-[acyl-carrier-protein] synthase II
MERALVDAHLTVQDISLVSAHASSTMLGDRAEACALEQLFGDCRPVVFATKGAHGHALGATPAIETAILALALQHQCAPRTVNLADPDGDCHLSLTDSATHVSARYALKNAFGFGGINACLVLAA